MNYNAGLRRANMLEHWFEKEGVEQMNWSVCSPDLKTSNKNIVFLNCFEKYKINTLVCFQQTRIFTIYYKFYYLKKYMVMNNIILNS